MHHTTRLLLAFILIAATPSHISAEEYADPEQETEFEDEPQDFGEDNYDSIDESADTNSYEQTSLIEAAKYRIAKALLGIAELHQATLTYPLVESVFSAGDEMVQAFLQSEQLSDDYLKNKLSSTLSIPQDKISDNDLNVLKAIFTES